MASRGSRYFKAATKVRDYHKLLTKPSQQPADKNDPVDYFFIKCDYKYERIFFDDILYVEAMQNYVTIFTGSGKYMTLLYLKNVEDKLDKTRFMRVHKSYIVSIAKIKAIENNEILIQNHRIPISRNYQDQVMEVVVSNKLWKRDK